MVHRLMNEFDLCDECGMGEEPPFEDCFSHTSGHYTIEAPCQICGWGEYDPWAGMEPAPEDVYVQELERRQDVAWSGQ